MGLQTVSTQAIEWFAIIQAQKIDQRKLYLPGYLLWYDITLHKNPQNRKNALSDHFYLYENNGILCGKIARWTAILLLRTQGDNSAWFQAWAIRVFLFGSKQKSSFFVKKKSEFDKASWAQRFNFYHFRLLKNTENRYKVIKFESLWWSCHIEFWLFFNKKWWLLFKAKKKFPDGTSLRPGWIVPLRPI